MPKKKDIKNGRTRTWYKYFLLDTVYFPIIMSLRLPKYILLTHMEQVSKVTLSYSTYFMSLCSSKIPLNCVYGHTLFILIRDLPIIGIIWEFLGLLRLLSFIHLHNLVFSASCLVLDPMDADWTLCPPHPHVFYTFPSILCLDNCYYFSLRLNSSILSLKASFCLSTNLY